VRAHDEPTPIGERGFEHRRGGVHIGRIGDRGAHALGGRQLGRIRVGRGDDRSGRRGLLDRYHLRRGETGRRGTEQREREQRRGQAPLHDLSPVDVRATSVPDSIIGQIQ